MRISDWSSDVCSSDLRTRCATAALRSLRCLRTAARSPCRDKGIARRYRLPISQPPQSDRTSVGSGKSVSVRVDLGGRRIIKKTRQRTIVKSTRIDARQITETDIQREIYKSTQR